MDETDVLVELVDELVDEVLEVEVVVPMSKTVAFLKV